MTGPPSWIDTDAPLFDLAAFSRRVRFKMAELNIGYRDAAKQARVSPATLNRAARAAGLPDVETYLRLEKWLSGQEETGK